MTTTSLAELCPRLRTIAVMSTSPSGTAVSTAVIASSEALASSARLRTVSRTMFEPVTGMSWEASAACSSIGVPSSTIESTMYAMEIRRTAPGATSPISIPSFASSAAVPAATLDSSSEAESRTYVRLGGDEKCTRTPRAGAPPRFERDSRVHRHPRLDKTFGRNDERSKPFGQGRRTVSEHAQNR